jgi:hypothetical protein
MRAEYESYSSLLIVMTKQVKYYSSPISFQVKALVRRLDRQVLESILLQTHPQELPGEADDSQLNEFDKGYEEAGDMYRVINALSVKERFTTVPLVCKMWRDLAQNPVYWQHMDFVGFTCYGGWLQRRIKLVKVATGFVSILSNAGYYVLSLDIANVMLFMNTVSLSRDGGFIKAVLRLCPNIISLKLAGKSITSAVLDAAARRNRLRKLAICETGAAKSTLIEGFLKLLQRSPDLEEISFESKLVSIELLNIKQLQWIRDSLREARGSHTSKVLIRKLKLVKNSSF